MNQLWSLVVNKDEAAAMHLDSVTRATTKVVNSLCALEPWGSAHHYNHSCIYDTGITLHPICMKPDQ